MRGKRSRRRSAKPALTAILGAGVAVVLVAGCGVPTQDAASPLPSGAIVSPPAPSSEPPPDPTASTTLWFVVDGTLVPSVVGTTQGGSQGLLDALASGPPAGSDPAARSLLADPSAGGALLAVTSPSPPDLPPGGTVSVAVTDAFTALPSSEQVLLIGQVVMTMTSAGADAVLVTDAQGAPLAIPLPDGRLLDGPANAADYAPLTHKPKN